MTPSTRRAGIALLKTVNSVERKAIPSFAAVMNYPLPGQEVPNNKNPSYFPSSTSYPSTKYNIGGRAVGLVGPTLLPSSNSVIKIVSPFDGITVKEENPNNPLPPTLSSLLRVSFQSPDPAPLTIPETLLSRHVQFQYKLTTIVDRIDKATDINQLLNHFLH